MSDEVIARWLVRSGEVGRVECPEGAKIWRVTATGPREGFATVVFDSGDKEDVFTVPAGATYTVEPRGFVDAKGVEFSNTTAFAVELRIE